MSIFKEVTGQGDDVVLLHGWGCDHRHMQPIVELLSKHYRVHNFDLPGRRDSDWDTNIKSIHDFADVLLPELPEKSNLYRLVVWWINFHCNCRAFPTNELLVMLVFVAFQNLLVVIIGLP